MSGGGLSFFEGVYVRVRDWLLFIKLPVVTCPWHGVVYEIPELVCIPLMFNQRRMHHLPELCTDQNLNHTGALTIGRVVVIFPLLFLNKHATHTWSAVFGVHATFRFVVNTGLFA